MVKLKAIIKLEDVHLAQAKNYLETYHMSVGLLINFGAERLDFKRVINKELYSQLKISEKSPNP